MKVLTSVLETTGPVRASPDASKRLINLTRQEAAELVNEFSSEPYWSWLHLLAHYSGRTSAAQLAAATPVMSMESFHAFQGAINRFARELPRIRYYGRYRDNSCELLLIDCETPSMRSRFRGKPLGEEYYVSAVTARALRAALSS